MAMSGKISAPAAPLDMVGHTEVEIARVGSMVLMAAPVSTAVACRWGHFDGVPLALSRAKLDPWQWHVPTMSELKMAYEARFAFLRGESYDIASVLSAKVPVNMPHFYRYWGAADEDSGGVPRGKALVLDFVTGEVMPVAAGSIHKVRAFRWGLPRGGAIGEGG